MHVTDEMVEAAARALYVAEMAREERTAAVLSRAAGKRVHPNIEQFDESAGTCWRPDARAALTAALAAAPAPVDEVERVCERLEEARKFFATDYGYNRADDVAAAASLLRRLSADLAAAEAACDAAIARAEAAEALLREA